MLKTENTLHAHRVGLACGPTVRSKKHKERKRENKREGGYEEQKVRRGRRRENGRCVFLSL